MIQVSSRPDGTKARYIHLHYRCFDANLLDLGAHVSHLDSTGLGNGVEREMSNQDLGSYSPWTIHSTGMAGGQSRNSGRPFSTTDLNATPRPAASSVTTPES